MYVDFGIYQEKLISITKKGKSGAEEILEMMKNFRENPPVSLGGSDVITIKDYKSAEEKNVKTGEVSEIDLPSSNVLQFITEDGAIISARPSGTEPKIKFYCSVNDTIATVHEYPFVQKKLMDKIDQIMEDLS